MRAAGSTAGVQAQTNRDCAQGQAGSKQVFINGLAGAISGACTAAFVCPLDVLKTRMQVQSVSNPKYTGIAAGLVTIVREEGLAAAYRGLNPTLMALLPTWALYFSTYEAFKSRICASETLSSLPVVAQNTAASIGAGVVNVAVTNPLWVVKTRLQTQGMLTPYSKHFVRPYSGTLHALHCIWRKEGMRGMYSGLSLSLIGIAHVAIQLPMYEALKRHAAAARGAREGAAAAAGLPMSDIFAVSVAAKMVASLATYPHEVVRSHLHLSRGTGKGEVLRICRQIYADEGIRGFYRGCGTNLMRTLPAAAITFTSYEFLRTRLTAVLDPFL